MQPGNPVNNTAEYNGRYEEKYILEPNLVFPLVKRVNELIPASETRTYSVTSLYFDTSRLNLLDLKRNGDPQKTKFRLRTYDAKSFFREVKLRRNNKTFKLRAAEKTEGENNRAKLFDLSCVNRWNFSDEILRDSYNSNWRLHPMLWVSYQRNSYQLGPNWQNIRMTIDKNIEFGPHRWQEPLAIPDRLKKLEVNPIIELKFGSLVPRWLRELRKELQFFRSSFSKYSSCMEKQLARNFYGCF